MTLLLSLVAVPCLDLISERIDKMIKTVCNAAIPDWPLTPDEVLRRMHVRIIPTPRYYYVTEILLKLG